MAKIDVKDIGINSALRTDTIYNAPVSDLSWNT